MREQVVGLLELLATRMQWSAARPIISSTGLHVSRGWAETIEAASHDFYSDAIWTAAYKRLAKLARVHTYVGNKRVTFFDLRALGDDSRAKILKWAKENAASNLAGLVRKRPFAILEAPTIREALEPHKMPPPKLIAADYVDGKLYLQFFSTRSYVFREPLNISLMSAAQQRAFSIYEELIGVRTKSIPCFDTAVIDTDAELVEIRVDFLPGVTEDKEVSPLSRVIGELNRIGTKYNNQAIVGVGLVNLRPVINPMYLDEMCGRVTALGFVATGKESSSNNRGQLHRSKTRDLRKDEFHAGGKRHVAKIDPYAIGVTWSQKAPMSDLSLEIRGNARSLYNRAHGQVNDVEIVGCLDLDDYKFVHDQVLSRLKRTRK
ncbi:hypothetical protein [Diaphorobacter aerolatus]|uniref:Uncharacterized protein n=1 Tax=Diaphorobacter aerolatus TaxID=1288495 RepID=A0A7H0GM29_9BURK|nr:hypothetical protein [Diaphorobacter aerolatus]QNP49345.1 hypothetical protein H9K75_04610 [Diaphorobacter aerolatus]